MRFPIAGFLCAMAGLLSGCAASSPDPAASCRQWQWMCEHFDTTRDTPAVAQPAAQLASTDVAALQQAARSAAASIVWIETTSSISQADDTDTGTSRREQPARATRSADPKGSPGCGGGTGIVLRANGLILTNEHVIRGASRVEVILADGSRHQARRIATADRLDLAVLAIDCLAMKPLELADCPARPGEPVVAVGGRDFNRPAGLRAGSVTNTSASLQNSLDPGRHRDYTRLIESTAPLEPGFSGGPLLDAAGRLVGLNVAVTGRPGQSDCRGYAIPLDNATRQAIDALTQPAPDRQP